MEMNNNHRSLSFEHRYGRFQKAVDFNLKQLFSMDTPKQVKQDSLSKQDARVKIISSVPKRLPSADYFHLKSDTQNSKSAVLQTQSMLHVGSKTQKQKTAASTISIARSCTGLDSQSLELPNRSPAVYAHTIEEFSNLSGTSGNTEAHGDLVSLISLPSGGPKSSMTKERTSVFSFKDATVRFPEKRSNVILEPKRFDRNHISTECVMLHSFFYRGQECEEIIDESPAHVARTNSQQRDYGSRPATATRRPSTANHGPHSVFAGVHSENSQGHMVDNTSTKSSTLVVTEKNSSASAFVQKLMTHISTKLAASSSVSIMSQKSVIYEDKDGQTETSTLKEFSHGAAGLQLAFVSKLDSMFQLRKFFLCLKEHASTKKFEKCRQELQRKMHTIKRTDRVRIQQEIDNEFSGVLIELCQDSTLSLIRCRSDDLAWSTKSLQRYFSALTEQCSHAMLQSCTKLSSLLKDEFDLKNRSLSNTKQQLFSKLLLLKKENEAHAIAAADLIELAGEFVDVIRYMIAWVHKILIHILQCLRNYFSIHHVQAKSSLALVCTWSTDNEITLSPDISEINGVIQSGFKLLHYIMWNVFKSNCGNVSIFEKFREIAPHVMLQMHEMKTFHSAFVTNCFLSKNIPDFISEFETSFDQIFNIVRSDALFAVNEAKQIEIQVLGSMKSITADQIPTVCMRHFQEIQDSFNHLDLAPSNFHQHVFSLNIKNEFSAARLKLQRVWESEFSQMKQRFKLQIENLSQRISKITLSLRSIELISKHNDELVQSAYQLHQAIVRAEEALPQMQMEKKAISIVCATIILCSVDGLVKYWEDFDTYVHFKLVIEEIARAKMSMMRSFDHLIDIFDSGQDDFSKKLRSLNLQLDDIDNSKYFSQQSVISNHDQITRIVGSALEMVSQVATLVENYTVLCLNSVSKPKGKHSEVVFRRTPQDVLFVATILAEKSQSVLSNWRQLLAKSANLEEIYAVTYAEAYDDFAAFEAKLNIIQWMEEDSTETDLIERFLLFHSEHILQIKSLYPFLKISIPDIRTAAFNNIMNIIFPANSSEPDASITFGDILSVWQSACEEQKLLIRERIQVQTAVAEKVNIAQSFMDTARAKFNWQLISVFQEVRFPQYSGHVVVFVNPDMSDLIASCETHINNVLGIILTFQNDVEGKTRFALSQFLEDFYVVRSFLQTSYACFYWCCCMLTITFERKGDEDQEEFSTWGGDPGQLDARNSAIKSYKLCMVSFFLQSKSAGKESLFDHLSYLRQARSQFEDVACKMHAVYDDYRNFTFFPIALVWFPSIILLEEDFQDAAILSLGPAGSSPACRCFSTLMKASVRKLFVNVSHITKDKDFGQPSTLTTLCGRSIGVESSTHLFGRSIHLSLLLQARSIKNVFKKCFLQTIHRFNNNENTTFSQLLSSAQLKDNFLESIILAILVKLSGDENDCENRHYVPELLESLHQVARDATDGCIHSAAALSSLVIIRDLCGDNKLRTACCWKFNNEDQSLRIEVGSNISVDHNLEVSSTLDWLMLLACGDSYLIRCLQAVAQSPRVLEIAWNNRNHSTFSHNLASLTGKQLSLRDTASGQMPFWIEAVSASKGFGIITSDVDDELTTFPSNQFLANVLKLGSVFWWASKSKISEIPNVLSASSLKPFLSFAEFEDAVVQFDCIYRTFCVQLPNVSLVKSAQEIPSNYEPLFTSFDKLSCKMIPSNQGQSVLLSKEFVISRVHGFNSCFERFPKLTFSNACFLLSPIPTLGKAHETIRSWITDGQKMVISGRPLAGKSTLIARVLKEFVQLGSIVQRFFWNGLLPTSSSIGTNEFEFIQLDVLNKFYANKCKSSTSIAWIDCQDFSSFPNVEVSDLNVLPLIIETQSISRLDPASLCAYNHYFLAHDETFCASNVLFDAITIEANECLVRKTAAQRLVVVKRVHHFFMDSLKFVFQHCSFSHNLELSDIHFVKNFCALMKSCCFQMSQSRCSTFGPSWWKKYNLCSETAFYHVSVFCTIWTIGGCLSPWDQDNYDVWVRTLGFEILSSQSLVNLKIPSIFNCTLSSSVASNGLRLQYFQDYELLEKFSSLSDTGIFCPSPKHYLFREIIRFLNNSGQTIALLGPSESGKSLFLKSICKQIESSKNSSGCSFVSFIRSTGCFDNIKKLARSFRDSSESQGSFMVVIDDLHWGLASSSMNHKEQLEVSQIYGLIRGVICNRTICLVDRLSPKCCHSISLYSEPILPGVGMIFGVSTSATQYTSPLLYSILATSFLLQPHSLQETTFQVLCSRAVDLKLRQSNRASTPIVEFSMPIMASVLYRANELLVANMKRLLLPHHYDIPSHAYFASTLLRLVDTFGCTLKENEKSNDRKKTKTSDFLAYVRAATSGLQRAKQAVANRSQDEYYLDPSSVWKAFAIQFRDLVSHFLSSHVMFEIERMLEESYFAEVNKLMVSAMNSVGCDHGGQLDAILSPIAKYILGSEPEPDASFILKSEPGDLFLQSYENMWIKYIYHNQEFKFEFMLGILEQEQNMYNSLSQLSGAFHQLAQFLKFKEPLLRIKCYEGADFFNLVELCESVKVFRYFSVRHIDILDDAKSNFRSEIRCCFQEDLCVLFAVNLQCNRYLENSHVTAATLHRALLDHLEIFHALMIEKNPSYLFDSTEMLDMANQIHNASNTQKITSLEAANEVLSSDFLNRFRFVIAVDGNPRLQLSLHDKYCIYRKVRSNSSVCSLFCVTAPKTHVLLRLFQQYMSYEVACNNWKEANLSVAGVPVSSVKMQMTGYLLFTAAIVQQFSLNSIFEFPEVSSILQRNVELCNMVCIKFMFHLRLFRDQFAFCIDKLQQSLKGINTIIKIHFEADDNAKRIKSELFEKQALLESLQAKYKVERSVFQQTSKNESEQIVNSRQIGVASTGPIRVSSLFSSSSYGSSVLETSRCLNEIQKLSDAEVSRVSKSIQEPKNVEERLISELLVTIFQYTQMGLTAATFSKSVADFKYRLAALSILQLPASSLELMMRFIRNPVLQLSDNPFYSNRVGLKLLMEWIQSIACQVYSRKKTLELPKVEDADTISWVESTLKKYSFLDDAAKALKDKNISSIEELKCRIRELQADLDPLNLILRSIKSMEPVLQEIKSRSKSFLRKLFVLEQFCEEISYIYSLVAIVCLPFCKENQDHFFEVIKDMTSDESLVKVGTVFHAIFSRYFVTMSHDNPISFQFLQPTNLRDFISLCATIINARDTRFLFSDDFYRFSDSQAADEIFEHHAVSAMCASKVVLILKDPFSKKDKIPTVSADVTMTDLKLLIKKNEAVFSNTVSCCSDLAKFCEIADQITQNSKKENFKVELIPLSTNQVTHDPLYSMESTQKIKDHGSQFAVVEGSDCSVSDVFRLVLPTNAHAVLKSIPFEGIPTTGFQLMNCYDFKKRFINATAQCLMNCVDQKMCETLSNIRASLSEFTSQKLSCLNAICSQLCEIYGSVGDFEGKWSDSSPMKIAESLSQSAPYSKSFIQLAPLLDTCIESLGPCLHFESNWREVSEIITSSVVWLMSECVSSLRGIDWKESVPKAFLFNLKRSPPQFDPLLVVNYRGNQAMKLANQISGEICENLRYCLSEIGFECSLFLDVVQNLVDMMATSTVPCKKRTIIECFETATSLPFLLNISNASYFYKLQLSMGLREFESSQNAKLRLPRCFWSYKQIIHEFIDSHPNLELDSNPDYEISNAPIEIRSIFVLLHLLLFQDTQLDKHNIENPMILNADFKISAIPEFVSAKKLYVMRFVKVILADHFDLFTENLRILNTRQSFVAEFVQIHEEVLLSILKRQSFSENENLPKLLRRLFASNSDSPHFGFLTSFLLGSTFFLSLIASYSTLTSPDDESHNKRYKKNDPSFSDLWNKNKAVAFTCGSKIEVQVAKDLIVRQFCSNFENPEKNHRIVKVSGVSRPEIKVLFENLQRGTTDENLVFFIEDLSDQSWLWTECSALSAAIQQLSEATQSTHKIVCFLQPCVDSHRYLSEARAIFASGSASSVFDVNQMCASLRWHLCALPSTQSRLLKGLAVVQWMIHHRLAMNAGSVHAFGHFAYETLVSYKGPIHALCAVFESFQNHSLSSNFYAQLLCEDLLSAGIHEHDVLLYRQLFVDFVNQKIDFQEDSTYDSSFAAAPRSSSFIYLMSESICAHLEINTLRHAFFRLCSKQVDVPFFSETLTHISKDIKENRGKCLELKTKLQTAVNDVEHMLPGPISEQTWISICSNFPAHLFPDLHPFLKLEGLILASSLNNLIDRVLESTTRISRYVKNENEMTLTVSADVGHLNLGIVPLSWDQFASSTFVRYVEFLSLLQFQKKIFDFVCGQLEQLNDMVDEEDQRLTFLSASVAVRSFSAYIVPNFDSHLKSSTQDMMLLLGEKTRISSIQQWMVDNSEESELLFWTPNHRFRNQLRREVMSPSTLHLESIKEFIRDTLNANADRNSTNEERCAITAFFSIMITKPISQFFIYDKVACKSRPCGQTILPTSGASSGLLEITQFFHQISEILFLTPNAQVRGSNMESVMQNHFICPLFRTPSCGKNVHKTLPHAFNSDSDPVWPTRQSAEENKRRTLPILNILFPSTDSFGLLSAMAATIMFQSKVPPSNDTRTR